MKKIFFIIALLASISSLASAQTDYLAGKTAPQVKTFLTLGNVENTAVSTWPGTSNITTLGTITTGTWNATVLTVSYGGTGLSTATTAYGIVCGGTTATGNFQVLNSLGTSGQFLKSNGAGALPSWASASTYSYSTITADQTAAVSNFYFVNKASTRDVVTLPSSATIGDRIAVQVDPTQATGWKLAQPATTKVYWGSAATTAGTGGYIQSTANGDFIEVVYQKNDGTNNLWYVISAQGQLTVN